MDKKGRLFLTTLAIAGFTIPAYQSLISETNTIAKTLEDISKKPIFGYLNREASYTLAAHGSHRSHGSHGSHRSHRSYHRPMDPHEEEQMPKNFSSGKFAPPPNLALDENKDLFSRNTNSTPTKSILPSSAKLSYERNHLKGSNKDFEVLTRNVQIYLSATGHYSGYISGKFDDNLITSISMYQRKNNLEVTGTLNDELVKHMNVTI
jgi:His-Xaa-Ser repeat protein HxsA